MSDTPTQPGTPVTKPTAPTGPGRIVKRGLAALIVLALVAAPIAACQPQTSWVEPPRPLQSGHQIP